MALNQQIIYFMTFHTYFTAFQTSAPNRITKEKRIVLTLRIIRFLLQIIIRNSMSDSESMIAAVTGKLRNICNVKFQ